MNSPKESFDRLLQLCADYPETGHGLPTNDPRSKQGVSDLAVIAKYISENLHRSDWIVKSAKGSGAFPRIPWIVIAPKINSAPKHGIYVALTFSENGKGLIAGAICGTEDKENWSDHITIVPKAWGLPINGKKPNTRYTDAFINPKGFYKKDLVLGTIAPLLEHLEKSIKKVEELMGDAATQPDSSTTINSRLWLLAPGVNAYRWEEQYAKGEAAIGWDALGDLAQYETRTEISNKLKELENLDNTPWNNSLACWQFPNEIKVGDWILVKKGKSLLLGYGVVTSDYIYDSSREQYRHIRKVDWKLKGEWDAKEFNLIIKTLTDLTPYPEYVAEMLTKMGVDVPEFITDRISEESIDKIQIATTAAMPQQVLSSYKLAVENSGFNFSDTLLKTFLASLISKPFTILTGASGTGKTKIAELLSHHLSDEAESSYAIVPVGADWTDTRNVLGFVNHLRDDGKGSNQPIFQSTEVLDILLNADQNPDYPHFLILDEMNLSHVERYFSDFLSVMEQNDGKLKLHSEGDLRLLRSPDDKVGVPQALAYAKNLFVIGTVNIDETTYMFSPKVLDRSNVIEFTISAEDIGAFLSEPKAQQSIERAEAGIAEGFWDIALKAKDSNWEQLPAAPAKLVADHLLNLFKILKDGRFEFAYRTAKEVDTYLRVCRHLSEDSNGWDAGANEEGTWKQDLDNQIMQKLLPKLHGSMGRIGNLLAALAAYCHTGTLSDAANSQTKMLLDAALTFDSAEATFPKSLQKLQAMIQTLRDEQFVSFIQ